MTLPGYWRSPLDPERVMNARVTHWQQHTQQEREEALTVEEPFEVRIDHRSLAVIMRTPGNDHELAFGFLYTEGVVSEASEVLAIEAETDEEGLPLANVVNVTLRNYEHQVEQASGERSGTFERHFAVSSSCGLCGKNSIDDLMVCTTPIELDDLRIAAPALYELPVVLRKAQSVFT